MELHDSHQMLLSDLMLHMAAGQADQPGAAGRAAVCQAEDGTPLTDVSAEALQARLDEGGSFVMTDTASGSLPRSVLVKGDGKGGFLCSDAIACKGEDLFPPKPNDVRMRLHNAALRAGRPGFADCAAYLEGKKQLSRMENSLQTLAAAPDGACPDRLKPEGWQPNPAEAAVQAEQSSAGGNSEPSGPVKQSEHLPQRPTVQTTAQNDMDYYRQLLDRKDKTPAEQVEAIRAVYPELKNVENSEISRYAGALWDGIDARRQVSEQRAELQKGGEAAQMDPNVLGSLRKSALVAAALSQNRRELADYLTEKENEAKLNDALSAAGKGAAAPDAEQLKDMLSPGAAGYYLDEGKKLLTGHLKEIQAEQDKARRRERGVEAEVKQKQPGPQPQAPQKEDPQPAAPELMPGGLQAGF